MTSLPSEMMMTTSIMKSLKARAQASIFSTITHRTTQNALRGRATMNATVNFRDGNGKNQNNIDTDSLMTFSKVNTKESTKAVI